MSRLLFLPDLPEYTHFRPIQFSAEETLSQGFYFRLIVSLAHSTLSLDQYLKKPISVTVSHHSTSRMFHGIVRDIQYDKAVKGEAHYQFDIVPSLAFLDKPIYRLFQSMSIPDILKTLLVDNGIASFQFDLIRRFPAIDYCCQYRESVHDFFHRLIHQSGLFYYYEHKKTSHTLVIKERVEQCPISEKSDDYIFHQDKNGVNFFGYLSELNHALGVRVKSREHSCVLMALQHFVYDWPSAQQMQIRWQGQSLSGALASPYVKPLAYGPEMATVIGKNDEEIDIDDQGRIKVCFDWPKEEGAPPHHSAYLPVVSSWGGERHGMHFLPRVKDKVLVQYLRGDPDTPVVMGSLYGIEQDHPFSPDQSKTRAGIKTFSTPQGELGHHLLFDDALGKEEVDLYSSGKLQLGAKKTIQVKLDAVGLQLSSDGIEMRAKKVKIL